MGFCLKNVRSDENHYSPFICTICNALVSLDCVVTSACSHPFCRICMDDYVVSRIRNNKPGCPCPTCRKDVTISSSSQRNEVGMLFGDFSNRSTGAATTGATRRLGIKPLNEAQPLAMKVLQQIQVTSFSGSKNKYSNLCEWTGNYAKLEQHIPSHETVDEEKYKKASNSKGVEIIQPNHVQRSSSLSFIFSKQVPEAQITEEKDQYHISDSPKISDFSKAISDSGVQPSHSQSLNQNSTEYAKNSIDFADIKDSVYDASTESLTPLKYNGLVSTNRSGVETLVHRSKLTQSATRDRSTHKGAKAQNYDDEDNKSINSHYSHHGSRKQQEKISPITIIESYKVVSPKLEDKKNMNNNLLGKKSKFNNESLSESHHDEIEVSIRPLEHFNASAKNLRISYSQSALSEEMLVKKAVVEKDVTDRNYDSQVDPKQEGTKNNVTLSNIDAIELSDKFKKQANAKFNKSDFAGSRELYSQGLRVMSKIKPVTNRERELVVTLYSNRAVTWFREKNFYNCITDCNKSLEYGTTYEKSYIRKWRALSALGKFDDATECLEEAKKKLPDSKKIQEELSKAEEQQAILTLANQMLENGEFQKAKDSIRPLIRSSDNISLLLCAATADAGLGLKEIALEKINKALKFNPNNLDALELQGYVLFTQGDYETSLRLLQKLSNQNRENKKIEYRMNACSTIISLTQKARAYAKEARSDYKRSRSSESKSKHIDSIKYYTSALNQSPMDLPKKSVLYSMIKIEKAEELLLSKQYQEAIDDCNDVLKEYYDNAQAWQVKTNAYVIKGEPKIVLDELKKLKRFMNSSENQPLPSASAISSKQIDEYLRRVTAENKILSVEDELTNLIEGILTGAITERGLVEGRGGSKISEYENRKNYANCSSSTRKQLSSSRSVPNFGQQIFSKNNIKGPMSRSRSARRTTNTTAIRSQSRSVQNRGSRSKSRSERDRRGGRRRDQNAVDRDKRI